MAKIKPKSAPFKAPISAYNGPKSNNAIAFHGSLEQKILKWFPYLLLAGALLLYANTLGNSYCLDDGIVLTENNFVKKGFAGMGKIFSKDSFTGALGEATMLEGGRYRPLSIATFAIEYQFFKLKPSVSHFINALLYGWCAIVLFRLMRRAIEALKLDKVPQWLSYAPFVVAVLFLVHPIHTEAVANIKGRDELLSFAFGGMAVLSLTNASALVSDSRKLMLGCLYFFLGLLSKESAITFFGVLVMLYWLHGTLFDKRHLAALGSLLAVLGVWALIRMACINPATDAIPEILNNPFMYAKEGQRLGTIAYALLRYIGLLFWPASLSYDYSFNQIPLQDLGSPMAISSLVIYGFLVVTGLALLLKRNVIALFGIGILWYTFSLLPVSNLIFDLGAIMGERLLFIPSAGFIMVFGLGLCWLLGRVNYQDSVSKPPVLLLVAMVIITLPSVARTVIRNADWQDNDVLFMHDVAVVPNSTKALDAAGNVKGKRVRLFPDAPPKGAVDSASLFYKRAIQIYPTYGDALMDIGTMYYVMKNVDTAAYWWGLMAERRPDYYRNEEAKSFLIAGYNRKAGLASGQKRFDDAIVWVNKALVLQPKSAESLFVRALLYAEMKRNPEAESDFEALVALNAVNHDYWGNYAGFLLSIGRFAEAIDKFKKAKALSPATTKYDAGIAAATERIRLAKP